MFLEFRATGALISTGIALIRMKRLLIFQVLQSFFAAVETEVQKGEGGLSGDNLFKLFSSLMLEVKKLECFSIGSI